jgi:hypothetical protein
MTKEVLNESDSVFCANPSCALHVRPGDPNVRGRGNWADMGDGIIIGRQRIADVTLCDRCAARVHRGETRIEQTPEPTTGWSQR